MLCAAGPAVSFVGVGLEVSAGWRGRGGSRMWGLGVIAAAGQSTPGTHAFTSNTALAC